MSMQNNFKSSDAGEQDGFVMLSHDEVSGLFGHQCLATDNRNLSYEEFVRIALNCSVHPYRRPASKPGAVA